MNDFALYKNTSIPFLAEALCACLIEQGMMQEQITINTKGGFKKIFRKDVERLVIDDETNKTTATLDINRDGLYDILPEGLFHQTRGMQAIRTVKDAVEEHRKYKEEEKYARNFFAPLENIIVRYRVLAELSERNALYHVDNEQLTNKLLDFWNIDSTLPRPESLRMLRLMPYMNTIKGDKQTTADALHYILNDDVYIQNIKKFSVAEQKRALGIEEMVLGVNAVPGINSNELIYGWQIHISTIHAENISRYVDGAPLDRLLKRFAEIFIPIERDVFFEFAVAEKQTNQNHEYILGYGCSI